MTDAVIISLESWDEVWRRNQHLVAGLLRTQVLRKVLFVEPASDPIHTLRRGKTPRRGSGLRRVNDVPGLDAGRLWAYQPTKWLPRKLAPKADERWSAKVRRLATRLAFADPVLWVNDPLGAKLLATGWPALYDITDDWLVADRSEAELARLRSQEGELLARCHSVVVCSPTLAQTKSTHRQVTLIPNAVELNAYRTRRARPADLPQRPVALYVGTAHRDRVDVDLCLATARRLGSMGGTVAFVGPAPLPAEDRKRLERSGVRFLGPRQSSQVPAYLQHADVLLVPHVLTGFTASLDPIKAYEYRAARRPVVATPVPGFADVPDSLVQAMSRLDFPEAVATAAAADVPWSADLPEDIPSWSQRVDQMANVIAGIVEESSRL